MAKWLVTERVYPNLHGARAVPAARRCNAQALDLAPLQSGSLSQDQQPHRRAQEGPNTFAWATGRCRPFGQVGLPRNGCASGAPAQGPSSCVSARRLNPWHSCHAGATHAAGRAEKKLACLRQRYKHHTLAGTFCRRFLPAPFTATRLLARGLRKLATTTPSKTAEA
jgi:hypothetical protein